MCGLAGIHDRDGAPVDSAALLRLREQMHLRGPDGAGLWLDPAGGMGLAHRRLAILILNSRGARGVMFHTLQRLWYRLLAGAKLMQVELLSQRNVWSIRRVLGELLGIQLPEHPGEPDSRGGEG
ncbi:MAG: hypothetical protein KGO02_11885 [Alphaproteobacteria bacterium]|nr:hypothetical protein [Alphaproteobacteria bacterium]